MSLVICILHLYRKNMRLYFFSKLNNQNGQNPIQSRIIDYFQKNGVITLSNLIGIGKSDGQFSFENMNALVIEGLEAFGEAGYLIALALSQAKPVLYLLPKGKQLPDQLAQLQSDKKLKKHFMLKFYNEKNLEGILQNFIDLSEAGEFGKGAPTIKFTLRITPRVERYLTWKTRGSKIAKADYLRGMVEAAIKEDENYQSFLRNNAEKETYKEANA